MLESPLPGKLHPQPMLESVPPSLKNMKVKREKVWFSQIFYHVCPLLFVSFSCVCVCYAFLYVYRYMYMWTHMCAHARKIPRSTFFYLILRGRLSQSNLELTDMVVSLTTYSGKPLALCQKLELPAGLLCPSSIYIGFWGPEYNGQ